MTYRQEAKLPLCRYIQDFKSKTTLEIKKNGFTGKRFWQPNYYEHIIGNEKALYKIRKYIQENPLKEKIDWRNIYSGINATATKNNIVNENQN